MGKKEEIPYFMITLFLFLLFATIVLTTIELGERDKNNPIRKELCDKYGGEYIAKSILIPHCVVIQGDKYMNYNFKKKDGKFYLYDRK